MIARLRWNALKTLLAHLDDADDLERLAVDADDTADGVERAEQRFRQVRRQQDDRRGRPARRCGSMSWPATIVAFVYSRPAVSRGPVSERSLSRWRPLTNSRSCRCPTIDSRMPWAAARCGVPPAA
jgi:hypothetical protein